MVRPGEVASAILLSLDRLFKLDNVTRTASVELWVLLTTLLLVVRFVIDFEGPWFGKPRRTFLVLTLEMLNQNMVIYTMGLMQLSGARKVNDYFQVWAVLLVTLQYSVKIGRPYTRSKQVPLLDLMSSFWSANLLRVQTFYLLRIPLWTIWSLNAVRIVVVFVSSGKGETSNQESMRLVSDYMSYEDTLCTLADEHHGQGQKKESATTMIMTGYKYLVYGEHRVLKEVKEGKRVGTRTLSSCFRKRREQVESGRCSYKIELEPDGVHKEQLVTIETIWNCSKDDDTSSSSSGLLRGEGAECRRDLCLSFALYKLLRRRFYDLRMHEQSRPRGKDKMRRLIFGYVLGNTTERAFHITGAELSFLRDLFYNKHATVFAGGLGAPLRSLLLSLCVAAATGYIAYPARYIPERMDPADRNRITHGVFITRLMVAIIVLKEMLEILLYLRSRWAQVLMLCMYAQHRWIRRSVLLMRCFWFPIRAFSEKVSMLCRRFCCKPNNQQTTTMTVRQQNLLVTVRVLTRGALPPLTIRMVSLRGKIHGQADLEDYTKDAILNQLRRLAEVEDGQGMDNYLSNAFGSNVDKLEWPCNLKRKVDTHIILVWHIATSLCEIYSFSKVKELTAAVRRPQPFAEEDPTRHKTSHTSRKTKGQQQHDDSDESASAWSEQYATAVTLSNYCVYLITKALVPDSRLVGWKVLDEVIREIEYVIVGMDDDKPVPREELFRSIKLKYVYDRLIKTVDKHCKNHHQRTGPADVEAAAAPPDHHQLDDDDDDEGLDIGCSLTRMGAVLGKKLTEEVYHGDAAGLWRDLANFWTGFLIHLAANTGATMHRRHLAGDSELITHLWALLRHASFRGNAIHGEESLDPEDIPDIQVAVN